jgi:hypothetical protein
VLVVAGCLMKAVVAKITRNDFHPGCPAKEGKNG